MEGASAKFHGNVAKFTVELGAEVPDDVLVIVGLAKHANFLVSDAEAVDEEALYGDSSIIEGTAINWSAFTAFAEQVVRVEGDFADCGREILKIVIWIN